MKETVLRARAFALIAPPPEKARVSRTVDHAVCPRPAGPYGITYSTFIRGLTLAGIELNRKTLSELAIHEPAIFDEIVEIAKKPSRKPRPPDPASAA